MRRKKGDPVMRGWSERERSAGRLAVDISVEATTTLRSVIELGLMCYENVITRVCCAPCENEDQIGISVIARLIVILTTRAQRDDGRVDHALLTPGRALRRLRHSRALVLVNDDHGEGVTMARQVSYSLTQMMLSPY